MTPEQLIQIRDRTMLGHRDRLSNDYELIKAGYQAALVDCLKQVKFLQYNEKDDYYLGACIDMEDWLTQALTEGRKG